MRLSFLGAAGTVTGSPEHRNTTLFAGFQAPGTRGQAMADGAQSIRIQSADVPVRAEVHVLDGLSAHADEREILRSRA